jgi:hypothetical protein
VETIHQPVLTGTWLAIVFEQGRSRGARAARGPLAMVCVLSILSLTFYDPDHVPGSFVVVLKRDRIVLLQMPAKSRDKAGFGVD